MGLPSALEGLISPPVAYFEGHFQLSLPLYFISAVAHYQEPFYLNLMEATDRRVASPMGKS